MGGAVGFIGYETDELRVRPRHGNGILGVPDFTFMLADVVVAFDHELSLIAPTRPGNAPEAAYAEALRRIEHLPQAHRRGPTRRRSWPPTLPGAG